MAVKINPDLAYPFRQAIKSLVEAGDNWPHAHEITSRLKVVDGRAAYGPDGDTVEVKVGDILTFSRTNGWEGSSQHEMRVTAIKPKSLVGTDMHSGEDRVVYLSRIEDSWLPRLYRNGSAGYVSMVRTAEQDREWLDLVRAEERKEQDFAAVLGEASKSYGISAQRTEAQRETEWKANSEAAEALLAKYADEYTALKDEVRARMLVEVAEQYPVKAGWVVSYKPTGYFNPLHYFFETEEQAREVAARIFEEGDPAVRYGKSDHQPMDVYPSTI